MHSIRFQYFAVRNLFEPSVICSKGISRVRATAAALNSELLARVATWSSSICAAAGRKGEDPAAPGGSTTKGVGLQNGSSVEIDDQLLTGATAAFVATKNGVQYSFYPAALIITQRATVLSNEPMLEYWSN